MSTYSSAVLALSPISYYRMNETSGTTGLDSGSDAHNLTYAGGVTINQSGCVPNDSTSLSVLFNGSNTSLAGSTDTIYGASSHYGIVAWIRTSTSPQRAVIANWGAFAICMTNATLSGAGTLLGWAEIGFATYGVSSTSVPADGLDHMVAAIYNNGTITLFLDGTLVETSTASFAQATTYGNTIGEVAGVDFWNGNIGDVAFVENLTAAQIANLYSIGMAPATSYVELSPSTAQSGAINITGTVTSGSIATGTISGTSASISGPVSTAALNSSSVTASGAISAASIAASGAISGSSAAITGPVSTGALSSSSTTTGILTANAISSTVVTSTGNIVAEGTLTTDNWAVFGGATPVSGASVTSHGAIFADQSTVGGGAFIPPIFQTGSSLGAGTHIVIGTITINVDVGDTGSEAPAALSPAFSGTSSYLVFTQVLTNDVPGWTFAIVELLNESASEVSITVQDVNISAATGSGTVEVAFLAVGG